MLHLIHKMDRNILCKISMSYPNVHARVYLLCSIALLWRVFWRLCFILSSSSTLSFKKFVSKIMIYSVTIQNTDMSKHSNCFKCWLLKLLNTINMFVNPRNQECSWMPRRGTHRPQSSSPPPTPFHNPPGYDREGGWGGHRGKRRVIEFTNMHKHRECGIRYLDFWQS